MFSLSACSDDDDDDEEGDGSKYAGVVEWRCFEGPDDCWCPGLEAGGEAMSSNPRVDACTYTNCYTYEWYGWHCECRLDPYTPDDEWDNAMSVPACPPMD